MIFSTYFGSIKTIIFIDQHSAKNKFFQQAFNQGCFPKISKNPQIMPDLRTFTEEICNENIQNLQKFSLVECVFLYSPVRYTLFF